jgi:Flp pilus assembly protein TadD
MRSPRLTFKMHLCITAVAALGLAGCQNKPSFLADKSMTTASINPAKPEASFKRTEELRAKWQAKPGDKAIGLEYAENLGALDQTDQQMVVLQSLAQTYPDDAEIQERSGKQALSAGKPDVAVGYLERAAQLPGVRWQSLNALGSAYDQLGRHAPARESYGRALAMNPGETSIQNNIAMSYSLEGKLPEAEKELRSALASPGGANMPRIRQNLALVVGLQGRFDEAREIASKDLPPDQVEANLTYLQQMLQQPNTWQQLSTEENGQPPPDANG